MTTYNLSMINFNNFDLCKPKTNRPICNITYSDTKLIIQCDPIRLTSHGIPPLDKKFILCDNDRAYINIPFDPNQLNCIELKKHFEAADKYFCTDHLKDKIIDFGYNPSLYNPSLYNTIVKYANNSYKTDYFKIKLDIDKIHKLKTIIFVNDQKMDISTVTELTEYCRFLSTIHFVFEYSYVWILGNSYGVRLTMTELHIDEKKPFYKFPMYDLVKLKEHYKEYMDNHKYTLGTHCSTYNRYTVKKIAINL